jgi:hypothetical protein
MEKAGDASAGLTYLPSLQLTSQSLLVGTPGYVDFVTVFSLAARFFVSLLDTLLHGSTPPRQCAHASIPIKHGGKSLKYACICARLNCLRTVTLPNRSTPCN